MDTPDLRNGSDATVEIFPQLGLDGAAVALVVIKQQWSFTEDNRLVGGDRAEIIYADELSNPDDPDHSGIALHSDICLHKPFTDVLVMGSAVPYGGTPAHELDVLVRVGPVDRTLKVYGRRVWYKGLTAMVPTPPEPFTAQPIVWEAAFGGLDTSDPNGAPLEEPRNPVGCGLARDPETLLHQSCPSVEDPRALISNHRSRPAPAGLSPIGRHWMPRRQFTGTLDEVWMKTRMPLLPLDFDARHNQCAPPESIVPGYLSGGELVQVHHMSALGPIQFSLPKLRFFVGAMVDGQLQESPVALDTVLLRPTEDRTLDLTWRALIPIPRPHHRLRYVQVHERAWV